MRRAAPFDFQELARASGVARQSLTLELTRIAQCKQGDPYPEAMLAVRTSALCVFWGVETEATRLLSVPKTEASLGQLWVRS